MSTFLPVGLIPHVYNGETILTRGDGHWNATAMCQANGKLWAHYRENASTKEFLEALSAVIGIPITAKNGPSGLETGLVDVRQGGPPALQGTWVHRRVAIHLAQWCSADFAVRVTGWMEELLTKGRVSLTGVEARPWSLRINELIVQFKTRVINAHPGHWSVVNEVTTELMLVEDSLAQHGFPLNFADLPDGSSGKRWAAYRRGKPWLRPSFNDVPLETVHARKDGCLVDAFPGVYHIAEKEHFDRWFRCDYLPEHLPNYLDAKAKRDRKRWEEAGLLVPAIAAVARAADGACRRITGAPARLPARLAAALPAPGQRSLFPSP